MIWGVFSYYKQLCLMWPSEGYTLLVPVLIFCFTSIFPNWERRFLCAFLSLLQGEKASSTRLGLAQRRWTIFPLGIMRCSDLFWLFYLPWWKTMHHNGHWSSFIMSWVRRVIIRKSGWFGEGTGLFGFGVVKRGEVDFFEAPPHHDYFKFRLGQI